MKENEKFYDLVWWVVSKFNRVMLGYAVSVRSIQVSYVPLPTLSLVICSVGSTLRIKTDVHITSSLRKFRILPTSPAGQCRSYLAAKISLPLIPEKKKPQTLRSERHANPALSADCLKPSHF